MYKRQVTYFIKEMYDSDMNTLTAYTITYDIKSDGKTVVSEKTPIVEGNPVCSPRFRASASVNVQQAAFATGVPPNI